METLQFDLPSPPHAAGREAALAGVVGSGNCEILFEAQPHSHAHGGQCRFTVHTSAVGFGTIWAAVLGDFAERRAVGGLVVEIHDVGATPAVVGLRLEQALEAWESGEAHHGP